MDSDKRNTIAALFIFGLLFRVLFLLYFHPIFTPDSAGYISVADNIREGRFYADVNEVFRQPGYPLYIALGLVASSGKWNGVILLQQILSSFVAIFIYLAAYNFFDARVAKLSGWLAALNPALAYYGTSIAMEWLLVFLVSFALLFLSVGLRKNKNIYFLVTGLLLSYLLWTKAIGFVIGLSFALAVLIAPDLSKKILKASLILLPVVLAYSLWSLHNYTKFGSFDFAPSYGLNLLERTIYLNAPRIKSPLKTQAYAQFNKLKEEEVLGSQADPIYWSLAVINVYRKERGSTDVFSLNDKFLKVALQQIERDPLGYLRSGVRELAFIWAGYTPHWAKWRPTEIGYPPDWSFLILGLILGFAFVILVILAALDNLLQRNFVILVIFVMPLILNSLVTAMVIPSDYRYRLLVEPLIIILVGYAIINLSAILHKVTTRMNKT